MALIKMAFDCRPTVFILDGQRCQGEDRMRLEIAVERGSSNAEGEARAVSSMPRRALIRTASYRPGDTTPP
jgi:hypothetical protein